MSENLNYADAIREERERWEKKLAESNWALFVMPDELKTYELCLSMVKRDGLVLDAVPMKYRDYDLCLAAFQRTPECFPSIPDEFRDEGMALTAVAHSALMWHSVPERLRTPAVAKMALRTFYNLGRPVPPEILEILAPRRPLRHMAEPVLQPCL